MNDLEMVKNAGVGIVMKNSALEKQNIADMFATVGKNDLKTFKKYIEENPAEGATILGVHLEGPFISKDLSVSIPASPPLEDPIV